MDGNEKIYRLSLFDKIDKKRTSVILGLRITDNRISLLEDNAIKKFIRFDEPMPIFISHTLTRPWPILGRPGLQGFEENGEVFK